MAELFPKARRFEAWLRNRGRAERTVANYLADVREFWRTRRGRHPSGITKFDVEDWATAQREAKAAPTSIRRRVASLATYFKCLRYLGTLTTNPTESYARPKVGKRLPKYLTYEEVNSLLAVRPVQEDFQGRRAMVELELLYATGMRVEELTVLTGSSLDLADATVRVLGKGDKERLLPLTLAAVARLSAWVAERGTGPDDRLFVCERGGRLSTDTVRHDIRRLGELAGLKRRLYPHLVRHTVGRHMLEAGADLSDVQELLGHSSPATTRIYSATSLRRLRAVMARHPRNAPPVGQAPTPTQGQPQPAPQQLAAARPGPPGQPQPAMAAGAQPGQPTPATAPPELPAQAGSALQEAPAAPTVGPGRPPAASEASEPDMPPPALSGPIDTLFGPTPGLPRWA